MTPPTPDDERRLFDRFGKVDVVVFSNIFWRGRGSNRELARKVAATGKQAKGPLRGAGQGGWPHL